MVTTRQGAIHDYNKCLTCLGNLICILLPKNIFGVGQTWEMFIPGGHIIYMQLDTWAQEGHGLVSVFEN